MEIVNRKRLDRWPPKSVYVGRPSPLGNPYRVGFDGPRSEVIARYADHLRASIERGDEAIIQAMRALREDSVLVCHCAPAPCHAEVIREVWAEHFADRPLVFVFGSNLAGRHGKGAALHAQRVFAAEYGVGQGATGSAWAIPTRSERLKTLTLEQIAAEVRRFVDDARAHPSTEYLVTEIGCGLAGYEPEDIAPMFAGAPGNCTFTERFRALGAGSLGRHRMRLVVFGSRSVTDRSEVFRRLDRLTGRFDPPDIAVVHGDARGADRLGGAWAEQHQITVLPLPARWEVLDTPHARVRQRNGSDLLYNARAGRDRNARMAAIVTHGAGFWDGASRGTRHMAGLLQEFGVPTRILTLQKNEGQQPWRILSPD